MIMKVLHVLLLLCTSQFVCGFVFSKYSSIKRICISCTPPETVGHSKRRSFTALAQQVSDEPHHSDITDDIGDLVGDTAVAESDTETVKESQAETQATADYEKQLADELQHLEATLRSERGSLTKLRDKLSESGKNGYFIVQAQVNDFTVR